METGTPGTVRTNGFIGRMIRLFTQSRVNHAFVVISGNRIVEAQPKGSVISPLAYAPNNTIWGSALLDYLEAKSPGVSEKVAAEAEKLVGIPYGFIDILALGLAVLGFKWGWLARKVTSSNTMICSQLVDAAFDRAGVHLYSDRRLPQAVTPGALEELFAKPQLWDTIVID